MKGDISKIVLIYYNFPPYASGGSFRPAKMAKFLPQFHISPTIICADKIPRRPLDENLMADIPNHLDIRRVPVRFEHTLFYKLMYKLGKAPLLNAKFKPETTIRWADDVLPVAEQVLNEKGIDTFLVSAPPWSMVVLGGRLKEKTGKRFILEYRDPWTQGPFYHPPKKGLESEFERMEEDALRMADAVVMVTDKFAKRMVHRWPFLVDKMHVVPNGYDLDDLPTEGIMPPGWENKFVLAYAGSIYTDYHTDVFIDGLKLWLDRKPELRKQVLLSYIGFMDRRQRRYINSSGLSGITQFSGYLSHRAAISMLCAAEVLILALPDIPNADGHISAKIYEYMASGTPVLASIPEGEMSHLIEKSGCGWVVPPADEKAVAAKLDYTYRLWSDSKLKVEPDADFVGLHTRRNAAGKLADIIRAVDRMDPE